MAEVIAEGKTKIVVPRGDHNVLMIAKDDITAGDGKRHDIIPGKGVLATETTCNVFEFLRNCRLMSGHAFPVAYIRQHDLDSFIAPRCRMLPWEVVVRAEAHGSYLKRHPNVELGTALKGDDGFPVEFYLKTKNRTWRQFDNLPCDDPLAFIFADGKVDLFVPDKPQEDWQRFLRLKPNDVFEKPSDGELFPAMTILAQLAFGLLRNAWKMLGYELVDMKVEFGINHDDQLLIADVIDNDSWRLTKDGEYLDKQIYRDGGSIADVVAKYRMVAELSAKLPRLLHPPTTIRV